MGARFRLKASFPTSGYRADTQTVLRAMKRYGLVLADNGSPWYFQGDRDSRWPSGLLDQLKTHPRIGVRGRRHRAACASRPARSRRTGRTPMIVRDGWG